MITKNDLPKTSEGAVIMETYNFSGWNVTKRDDGTYYAMCECYNIIAQNADEMVAKLNELEAVVIGWE